MKYKSGFTLIEIMVCVSVILILVGIIIPIINNVKHKAKKTQVKENLLNLKKEVEYVYNKNNFKYPSNFNVPSDYSYIQKDSGQNFEINYEGELDLKVNSDSNQVITSNNYTGPDIVGSGTSSDPYIIYTTEGLKIISKDNSYWDNYIELGRNIDASDTQNWNDGKGFSPIGNLASVFLGTFDGKEYTISNLYINRTSMDYVGLFGYVGYWDNSGGVIKNIKLNNINITGNNCVGGIVGIYTDADFPLEKCQIINGNINGNENVGGVAGSLAINNFKNNYFEGNVNGINFVGGLIGSVYATNFIKQSYSLGQVNGKEKVGGLIGEFNVHGASSPTVKNAYSNVDVNGNDYVGGLIGDFYDTYSGIPESENCYSLGNVSGNTNVGGLIGGQSSGYEATTKNCYWNIETSSQTISYKGIDLTTSEMKDKSSYNNWDFTNVWGIDSNINDGYPYLRVFND